MKKLRWGLVGTGDIARKRVAPALRTARDSEFVAINRRQANLAEGFAREFGARKWYAGYDEMLADAEIDAIYVATPVNLHADQTIRAAEAGKHVLCEKPMALDPGECERMIAACEGHNVKLGVAYYRHFYPVVKRVKEIIDAGEIGRVVVAQINAFEFFNPPPGDSRSWFIDPQQAGGGPMFDFGCHRIEVLLNLLGQITRAHGFLSNNVLDLPVEDTGIAVLQFSSGVQAQITVSRATATPQDTLDVYGTRGSLHVAVLNDGALRVVSKDGERLEHHPPHANLHQPLVEDFVRAVLDSREPAVSGVAGRAVAEIERRIYGST